MRHRSGWSIMAAVFLTLLPFPGPGAAEESRELTVSAAVSLKNAFIDIARTFAKLSDVRVVLNFGASGDLAAQIRGGAPADVFASAAAGDMDGLERDGLVLGQTRADFASNRVVLIVPKGSTRDIASFEALKRPDVERIAVGNVRTVPAGRYAEEVFRAAKLAGPIRQKLVFAGNVRQVLDYVARREADAGLVYETDAQTRSGEVTVAASAPAGSHRPVVYPAAVVKGTHQRGAAEEFIRFLTSPGGSQILRDHGFRPAPHTGRRKADRHG